MMKHILIISIAAFNVYSADQLHCADEARNLEILEDSASKIAGKLVAKRKYVLIQDKHDHPSNALLYNQDDRTPHDALTKQLQAKGIRHVLLEGTYKDGNANGVNYYNLEYYDREARLVKLITGYLVLTLLHSQGNTEQFNQIGATFKKILKNIYKNDLDVTAESLPHLKKIIFEKIEEEYKPEEATPELIRPGFLSMTSANESDIIPIFNSALPAFMARRDEKIIERINQISEKEGDIAVVAGGLHIPKIQEKIIEDVVEVKSAPQVFDSSQGNKALFYQKLLN